MANGANAVEIDVNYRKEDAVPFKTLHGDPCDCSMSLIAGGICHLDCDETEDLDVMLGYLAAKDLDLIHLDNKIRHSHTMSEKWVTLHATGNHGNEQLAKDAFNIEARKSDKGIIRRLCSTCATSHQEVYFRRKNSPHTYDYYEGLMVIWRGDVGFHSDFDIYSTLQDAENDQNAWKYCNGNDHKNQIGFPRDCGKSSKTNGQWNSFKHPNTRKDYQFSAKQGTTFGTVAGSQMATKVIAKLFNAGYKGKVMFGGPTDLAFLRAVKSTMEGTAFTNRVHYSVESMLEENKEPSVDETFKYLDQLGVSSSQQGVAFGISAATWFCGQTAMTQAVAGLFGDCSKGWHLSADRNRWYQGFKKAQERGIPIRIAWTVDQYSLIAEVIGNAGNGIITNYPDAVRDQYR